QSLFFNRMEAGEWRPYGVKVDPKGGSEFHPEGPVYMVSPDGKQALSPSLTRIWSVQPGYGVIVPPEFRPEPRGASNDDGLFITDTETGATRLLVSFRHIYETLRDQFKTLKLDEGGFYGFHTKWAPSGKRILFIIRWRDHGMRKGQSLNWIVTMDDEGKNL